MKFKNKPSRISNNELARCSSSISPYIGTLISSLGFELFKVEFTGENQTNYLRITITHPDKSISLDDCEIVSRALDKELDKLNLIPFQYVLEVQSPGNNEEDLAMESFSFKLKNLDLVVKS